MLCNILKLLCLLGCTSPQLEQSCGSDADSNQVVRSDQPLQSEFAKQELTSLQKRRRRRKRSSHVLGLRKLVGCRLYLGEFLTPQFLGRIETARDWLGISVAQPIFSCRGPPVASAFLAKK